MAWFGSARRRYSSEGSESELLRQALGQVLCEDWEAAEQTLSGMVQADSGDTDTYLALAQLYRRGGEVGRAIRVHQNLLLREEVAGSARVKVLCELGQDFRTGGFAQRAISSYEEALALDPGDGGAAAALLVLLVEEGEYKRALALRRGWRRIKSDRDPDAEVKLLYRLAVAAWEAGDSSLARKLLKRGLRRRPEHAESRYLMGELEVQRGRGRAALAIWRGIIEHGGPGADAAYAKAEAGSAVLRQGKRHETFLRAVIKERADDPAPRLALARALAGRGESDEAVKTLRLLLDRWPDSLQARTALGEIFMAEHRDPDALKEFAELLGILAAKPRTIPESGE